MKTNFEKSLYNLIYISLVHKFLTTFRTKWIYNQWITPTTSFQCIIQKIFSNQIFNLTIIRYYSKWATPHSAELKILQSRIISWFRVVGVKFFVVVQKKFYELIPGDKCDFIWRLIWERNALRKWTKSSQSLPFFPYSCTFLPGMKDKG